MYSPIERDAEGRPVGGGANTITSCVACVNCGAVFQGHQTELEKAKGEPVEWKRAPWAERAQKAHKTDSDA